MPAIASASSSTSIRSDDREQEGVEAESTGARAAFVLAAAVCDFAALDEAEDTVGLREGAILPILDRSGYRLWAFDAFDLSPFLLRLADGSGEAGDLARFFPLAAAEAVAVLSVVALVMGTCSVVVASGCAFSVRARLLPFLSTRVAAEADWCTSVRLSSCSFSRVRLVKNDDDTLVATECTVAGVAGVDRGDQAR
jgi:hypothetical protein